MSRYANIAWREHMRQRKVRKDSLETRIRLRIAKAELEGRPTEGLKIMLEDLLREKEAKR